ncbi:MAG: hypothetical protein AB1714_30540 [Acidobacteriota bacterium]
MQEAVEAKRSYGCTISIGGGRPSDAVLSLAGGRLMISGAGLRTIDLLQVEGLTRQDLMIGLRVYPDELLLVQKLGRDFEMFYDELRLERRNRILKGLFLQDTQSSKAFPCQFGLGTELATGDIEVYPTSVLCYPDSSPPFHLPLSYVLDDSFDPDDWSVNLQLIEGSVLKVRKLGKLTDEFRETIGIAMRNHAGRAARLGALLAPNCDLLPGIPIEVPAGHSFETAPILRRQEAAHISGLGTCRLCVSELNTGLSGATDERAIPDDELLLRNSFLYLMCEAGSSLIVEVLNQEDHATYVFGLGEVPPLSPPLRFETQFFMHIARALDSINFRREPIYEDAETLAAGYAVDVGTIERKSPSARVLRHTFLKRIVHAGYERWASDLDACLRGRTS